MRGWLVYNEERLKRNVSYVRMHESWCKEHGVELRLVLVERMQYGLGPNGVWFAYDGELLDAPDFAVFRCEELDLRRLLELGGVVVANGSRIGLIANDKLRTYELAHKLGMAYLAVFSPSLVHAEQIEYPLVVKPRRGHGGEGVRLVEDAEGLKDCLGVGANERNGDEWLCQRVAPVVGKDLRVYVMGSKVLAAMLRSAPKGAFLSNYCRGGSACEYDLSDAEHALVAKVGHALGPGYYGIDFLFDNNGGLLLNEIEDVVGSRMLYTLTSIDVVGEHLMYVLSLCEQRDEEDALCR